MQQLYKFSAFLLLCCISTWAQAQYTITTIAGSKYQYKKRPFNQNGGVAVNDYFSYPYGVTADAAGNLYVAAHKNNRVYKIDVRARRITTVAGTGAEGYSWRCSNSRKTLLPCGHNSRCQRQCILC